MHCAHRAAFVALGSLLASAACHRAPKVDSAAIERAADRIATASCEHELRCIATGPSPSEPRRADCLSEARENVLRRLQKPECATGVDEAGVTACVVRIESDPCRPAVERVPPLEACSTSDLCPRRWTSAR